MSYNTGLSMSSNLAFNVAGKPAIDGKTFLPNDLGGLFLWLDADASNTIMSSGGLVSQWNDKSDNGFNVTQGTGANQPTTDSVTQNGKNVIDFDQTDFLIIPSGFYTISNGANTVFCVNKTDDNNRLQILIGTAEGGSTRMDLRKSATPGTITYQSRGRFWFGC